MSITENVRLRRFFQAVASGYVLLIANILYVLGSVPLALHFLEKREFGLWALAMQLTGYLQLIDVGMSASISRHLIDHKDKRTDGHYGGMIQTGALVLVVQGLLVLVGGALLVMVGTRFLNVDPDLERPFKIVMVVQCAIIAADFPARLSGHLLIAHQRTDITNYSQIGLFFISYAVLWYCFAQGLGIFSLIWANVAGWLVIASSNMIACSVLEIFPSGGTWGRASWSKFRDLFKFGKDIFWIAVGTQMINASQAIVVTRSLGLNAAAIWSVCTRTYVLANQLVWRPFDYSYPALSEMFARGEKDRLLHRFKGLVTLTTSFSVLAAVMFALCNKPFVTLWTHGKISWALQNDILLAIWLIVSALVHCHCSLPGITKQIGFMRYIYFFEGIIFLGIGSFLAARVGFSGMLTTSIFASLVFSCSYGIWRAMREFDLGLKDVAFRWLEPSIKLFASLSFFALILYWPTRNLPAQTQLPLYAALVGTVGCFLLLRVGLSRELQEEFRKHAPSPISKLIEKIVPSL
jgi:O-antigen/teichoic acid export membrane protein